MTKRKQPSKSKLRHARDVLLGEIATALRDLSKLSVQLSRDQDDLKHELVLVLEGQAALQLDLNGVLQQLDDLRKLYEGKPPRHATSLTNMLSNQGVAIDHIRDLINAQSEQQQLANTTLSGSLTTLVHRSDPANQSQPQAETNGAADGHG